MKPTKKQKEILDAMSEKAKEAMESAIFWNGRRKANLAECISKLKRTGFESQSPVKETIEFLTIKRKEMDKKQLF